MVMHLLYHILFSLSSLIPAVLALILIKQVIVILPCFIKDQRVAERMETVKGKGRSRL